MTKKELMIKAHKMTKEIKTQYPSIDYKFQLGLCLSYLQEEGGKEMIKYTTKNGAKVEIALDGKLVTDLTVNGIEIVKNNSNSDLVFISTFDNTIVLNSSVAYKKLGGKSVIRIAANNEVISVFNLAVKELIEKSNKEIKTMSEITKRNNERKGITEEQFLLTFEKHMNDKNSF